MGECRGDCTLKPDIPSSGRSLRGQRLHGGLWIWRRKIDELALFRGEAERMARPIIQMHNVGNEGSSQSWALTWTVGGNISWVDCLGPLPAFVRS